MSILGGPIVVLYNPASGRGRAARAASAVLQDLHAAGWATRSLAVGPASQPLDIPEALRGASLLVIVGGDGTVHHALGAAIAARVPVYQVPLGTENLFSREFGMDRRPRTLRHSLRPGGGRIVCADAAEANGTPFAVMASIGFDASVVARVAASRRSAITRAIYVRRGVEELLRPRGPGVGGYPMTISVDGRVVVRDEPGLVIVAVSKHYAARMNPARHARADDGLLDVVFYPFRSRVGLAGWAASTALGLHTRFRSLRYVTGRRAMVEASGGSNAYQLDGERPATSGGVEPATPVTVQVLPGALKVLTPTGDAASLRLASPRPVRSG